METTTTLPKLYALLGAPRTHGTYLVIQLSFDKEELERIKAAIEAQTYYFTPKLEIREVDDHVAEWYWPEKHSPWSPI